MTFRKSQHLTFLLVFLVTGCATNIQLPVHDLSNSEAVGMGKLKISTGIVQSKKLVISNNIKASPPSENPDLENSLTLGIGGHYGLLPFLDAEVTGGLSSPLYFGVKLNFLGDTEDSAGQNNFSLSMRLGVSAYLGQGETESSLFGTKRVFQVSGSTNNLEVLGGWRPFGPWLIYFSYYSRDFNYIIDFVEGIEAKLRAQGNYTGLIVGNEIKMNNLSFGLTIGSVEYQVEEDPSENTDGIMAGLHAALIF